MSAISSPLPGLSGVGSTSAGWPAASGPVPASGSRPPRQVRGPGSPGQLRVVDDGRRRPPSGSVTRQKPPLWSATQVRPFGSTSAPAEMCRPPVKSVEPLWLGGPAPQPGAVVRRQVGVDGEAGHAGGEAAVAGAVDRDDLQRVLARLGVVARAAGAQGSNVSDSVEGALERGAVLGAELEPRRGADRSGAGRARRSPARSGATVSTVKRKASGWPVTPSFVARTERT